MGPPYTEGCITRVGTCHPLVGSITSMLFGAISSSLKALTANQTLRNGPGKQLSGSCISGTSGTPRKICSNMEYCFCQQSVSSHPLPPVPDAFSHELPFCQPLVNLTGAGTIFVQFFLIQNLIKATINRGLHKQQRVSLVAMRPIYRPVVNEQGSFQDLV